MLQRIVVILSVLLITSCTTGRISDGKSVSEVYFKGNVVRHWEKGLDYLKDNPESEYLREILQLYLNDKFVEIREELGKIINYYIDTFDIDYNIFIEEMYTRERVELVLFLSREWLLINTTDLAEAVYISAPGDLRTYSIEILGREVLEYKHILLLYNNSDKNIRMGAISSAGYILEEIVLNWLGMKLFDSDEETALASIFSISKHGRQGFELLANSITRLNSRLKLTIIDILTSNKVEAVLRYYPEMLLDEDSLISDRIIKSIRDFGKKADGIIIKALESVSEDKKISLLKILETRQGNYYFRDILFLLEYPNVRDYVIDIYFKNSARELIKEIVLIDYPDLQGSIVNYAIKNNSDIIFYDDELKKSTLYYFLESLDFVTIFNYFVDVGFEDEFIDDYVLVNTINSALQKIEYIEKLNGVDKDVTKYFELEQDKFLAEKEARDFYQGLENWLETGDNKFLDQSASIKESNSPRYISLKKEKEDFMNSLSEEKQASFYDYEESKLRVVYDYRQLTYRLKDFGQDLIVSKGFQDLIK